MIDSLTPFKAFGVGCGMLLLGAKFWVVELSAIATIGEAQLGQPSGTAAYLIFILLAESLLLIPILIRITIPKQSESVLDRISAWLTKYNRPIVIVVSLVFGFTFLY